MNGFGNEYSQIENIEIELCVLLINFKLQWKSLNKKECHGFKQYY